MLLHDQAYLFNDYWEDIGTVKSFFDANLALTEQVGNKPLRVATLSIQFWKIPSQIILIKLLVIKKSRSSVNYCK